MTATGDLIVKVLEQCVEAVADPPRRVLFRDVSGRLDHFAAHARQHHPDWIILATGRDTDVVGARNDPRIETLVVFYVDEVQERESLNAFRQFDEGAIVTALVQHATAGGDYAPGEIERLWQLLDQTFPSVDQVAEFLQLGKEQVGDGLPLLGLFYDPDLRYDLPAARWRARVLDNHATAVLRWREFLDRARRSKEALAVLGPERISLLARAEDDPQAGQEALKAISYDDALQALNPPTRIVMQLMTAGTTRADAEQLVTDVKVGRVDPTSLPAGLPPLTQDLVDNLRRLLPTGSTGEGEVGGGDLWIDVPSTLRVQSCLLAILSVASQDAPMPARLLLRRRDDPSAAVLLMVGSDGRLAVGIADGTSSQATSDNAAVSLTDALWRLSAPGTGDAELSYQLVDARDDDRVLLTFTLNNLASQIDGFEECWPADPWWASANNLSPDHHDLWDRLSAAVQAVRAAIDPVAEEQEGDEAPSALTPTKNNSIYQLFDLVYIVHRPIFEQYLDAWIQAATLPWRASEVAAKRQAWLTMMAGLLDLGLAHGPNDAIAVLPHHPLRLAWHRAVTEQVEQWLAQPPPLLFEPEVLARQLMPRDRPRVLYRRRTRLMEATVAPFFSLFVPESQHRRARAPLERARQKADQFGRMWPFSLSRLHIAFQPSDAGEDVYRLVRGLADESADTAFQVMAVVDNAAVATTFDRLLLNPGEDATDLLTQEHHESLLPRVDYSKGQLSGSGAGQDPLRVEAHLAILVDAFREEAADFELVIGQLGMAPQWNDLHELVRDPTGTRLDQLKHVSLSAPSFHSGAEDRGERDIVYVPLEGSKPEALRLVYDSLTVSVRDGAIKSGAYYERVRWDAAALQQLHRRADWVILFDRTLEKALFDELRQGGVKLIDYYPSLRGGYRMSVSSSRTEAVKRQLVQVLQGFSEEALDLSHVADYMLQTLATFASGLLLKTLGGGSLAQELLGLYATYLALIDEGELNPATDWLIPLDDHQDWFGRRTRHGSRADLLVLRSRTPSRLELLAVESKWYKQIQDRGFVTAEFGPPVGDGLGQRCPDDDPEGQMGTTVTSLRRLFDPRQHRLDRDYWQRTLRALVDSSPHACLTAFKQQFTSNHWQLDVDGIVYVHQYEERDAQALAQREVRLGEDVRAAIGPLDDLYYHHGTGKLRLRLNSRPAIVRLLKAVTATDLYAVRTMD